MCVYVCARGLLRSTTIVAAGEAGPRAARRGGAEAVRGCETFKIVLSGWVYAVPERRRSSQARRSGSGAQHLRAQAAGK